MTQDDRPTYDAQDVRQGQTVLRAPWQKIVFFGGLAAFVVLSVAFGLLPHIW